MTVPNLIIVAFVAAALNGLFGGLALSYWMRARTWKRATQKLRVELATAQAELVASRQWNDELVAARNVVDQAVTQDPMHLNSQHGQHDDPLEHLFRMPSAIRNHERGQQ